ncbi:MAG TPA: inositol monophosphatase family protein [Solirubrobacterales bacterium]|nr:inositol monophosphatase family protein [Solirubrobacterales bacterium]
MSARTSSRDIEALLVELARGLRAHVQPFLGSHAHREHLQAGTGGDVTFAIDEEAESWVEEFLGDRAPDVAFYSEDRGLVTPAGRDPVTVLVIDPIDGTRPAMAGLECCCVSVAAAPLGDSGEPTMGDVYAACVAEIKTGGEFVAVRGAGLEAVLSANTDVSRLFWTLGFRGRPAVPLVTVLEELIDRSSVGGAVFDLGSATFDMTRILTGQLDGYVDIGTRMIDEVPALRPRFEAVGGGAVLNNSPYDLAAAVLCLEEAGAVVTDAYGRPLAARPLLGSGHEFQMSCLAAANRELHAGMLALLERGFARLRSAM